MIQKKFFFDGFPEKCSSTDVEDALYSSADHCIVVSVLVCHGVLTCRNVSSKAQALPNVLDGVSFLETARKATK